jgi:hypothetical protein
MRRGGLCADMEAVVEGMYVKVTRRDSTGACGSPAMTAAKEFRLVTSPKDARERGGGGERETPFGIDGTPATYAMTSNRPKTRAVKSASPEKVLSSPVSPTDSPKSPSKSSFIRRISSPNRRISFLALPEDVAEGHKGVADASAEEAGGRGRIREGIRSDAEGGEGGGGIGGSGGGGGDQALCGDLTDGHRSTRIRGTRLVWNGLAGESAGDSLIARATLRLPTEASTQVCEDGLSTARSVYVSAPSSPVSTHTTPRQTFSTPRGVLSRGDLGVPADDEGIAFQSVTNSKHILRELNNRERRTLAQMQSVSEQLQHSALTLDVALDAMCHSMSECENMYLSMRAAYSIPSHREGEPQADGEQEADEDDSVTESHAAMGEAVRDRLSQMSAGHRNLEGGTSCERTPLWHLREKEKWEEERRQELAWALERQRQQMTRTQEVVLDGLRGQFENEIRSMQQTIASMQSELEQIGSEGQSRQCQVQQALEGMGEWERQERKWLERSLDMQASPFLGWEEERMREQKERKKERLAWEDERQEMRLAIAMERDLFARKLAAWEVDRGHFLEMKRALEASREAFALERIRFWKDREALVKAREDVETELWRERERERERERQGERERELFMLEFERAMKKLSTESERYCCSVRERGGGRGGECESEWKGIEGEGILLLFMLGICACPDAYLCLHLRLCAQERGAAISFAAAESLAKSKSHFRNFYLGVICVSGQSSSSGLFVLAQVCLCWQV